MDSLTQALLGASIQGASLGKYQGRKSLLYGAVLATLPDLDVLIRYADPIDKMTRHRGFSHSVFVLSALALLLSWLIYRYRPNRPYGFGRLFGTLWLVLITHALLDAFTVYGTQLFWPFTPTPQQWSGIFIVDPLYTVPMLLAVIYALFVHCRTVARRWLMGVLLWGCLYLAWGTYGQYHHQKRVQAALIQQGITVKRIMATPMPLNTLLFRVLVESDDGQYIEVISGWFDKNEPEWIMRQQNLPLHNVLTDASQVDRLSWFADGWLRYDVVDKQLIVTDLRMGVAGRHFFRFIVAQKNQQNQWEEIPIRRYTAPLPSNLPALRLMWRRIIQEEPLPLQKWADFSE